MPNLSSSSVKVTYPRFDRAALLAELRGHLPALAQALPLVRVVLFGSWAIGRATAYSDIDLLVIYSGPPREDAFATVRRHVPLRGLEPHVYTDGEAAALARTLDRMTREGVPLL